MKNHLKRIASPRAWVIARKHRTFTLRPHPGAHPQNMGLPLGVILRDMLKLATTMSEVTKLLHANEVLVDGRRRQDHRHLVGLFDVLTIPSLQKYYRMSVDEKGRLVLLSIPVAESTTKVCKVLGKSVVKGGSVMLRLHDGRTVPSSAKINIGDSVVISLPDQKITESIALGEGVHIFLAQGKHAGSQGTVRSLKETQAVYADSENNEVRTSKQYLFVVGKTKPLFKVVA
ncbi:30S ribosomal protein S4e [Candidatus Woesearchaeota archaeon]|nr:30S ribosomal protein S4e [Candidatus Woesearchaeota archaeon]